VFIYSRDTPIPDIHELLAPRFKQTILFYTRH
jgi:hypothetical protein